jgi:hypothetical protein
MKLFRHSLLVLASVVAFGFATNSALAQGKGGEHVDNDQPHMHKALKHLDAAVHALEAADDDKKGHRKAAIEDAKAAFDAVKAGIEAAKANGGGSEPEGKAGKDPKEKVEGQTHMKVAHNQLEDAKKELQERKEDKGGYGAKAIDSIDKALKEVQEGIEAGRGEGKGKGKGSD